MFLRPFEVAGHALSAHVFFVLSMYSGGIDKFWKNFFWVLCNFLVLLFQLLHFRVERRARKRFITVRVLLFFHPLKTRFPPIFEGFRFWIGIEPAIYMLPPEALGLTVALSILESLQMLLVQTQWLWNRNFLCNINVFFFWKLDRFACIKLFCSMSSGRIGPIQSWLNYWHHRVFADYFGYPIFLRKFLIPGWKIKDVFSWLVRWICLSIWDLSVLSH